MPKRLAIKVLAVMAVLGAMFFGYRYWQSKQLSLPPGIVSGNGRIEAKLVDAAAKEALRVKKIYVDEGDLVEPGQVVVQLDTVTLDAQMAEAEARVAAAREGVAIAKAGIVSRKSQIRLARIETERTRKLVEERAGSQRDYDVSRTRLETTIAGLAEEEARLQSARQEVKVAQANAATIRTRIEDATLKSPARGRLLYRLAEVGEVLAPGGKVLTIVNLEDVYMEIFLPAEQAARTKIGAEARITIDNAPGRAAAGYVSFVSPEAQFTPKQVETLSEREKLMFRVKIKVPEELVSSHIEFVKTGIRGVGYVKLAESAAWPPWLQNLFGPTLKDSSVTRPVNKLSRETP